MRFNQVEFGRRLKALRKERGMTQEELAAALSITPNHLGKIELGKRGISFDVLLGVSEVLDISLDVLIKGKRHISPQALQLIGQMRIALDQLEGNERNPDYNAVTISFALRYNILKGKAITFRG